ncbi:gamma-interferon-responsive lysosomal thiol protein-like [Wolffia australiana]
MASGRGSIFCFLPLLLVNFIVFSHFPVADASKVRLDFYYETLCPYCSRFTVNFLSKVFENGLIDIIDLNLVPYGNARVGPSGAITCQHGADECLLNTVEACAISTWPDATKYFPFINCVEKLVVARQYSEWQTCFKETGLDSKPVMDCYKSDQGYKLELAYAAETAALQPPHKYVPWVVVDGKPLYEDYEKFETEICKAYKGVLPEACKGLLEDSIYPAKFDEPGRVCLFDDLSNHPKVNFFTT